VVNLSRFSQAAELDLNEFSGYVPMEIFSKNNFPEIREDHPYFFTLSPYAYHWFHLQKVHAEVDDNKNLPMLEVKKWKDVLTSGVLAQLERKVLPEYLNKMRWFG